MGLGRRALFVPALRMLPLWVERSRTPPLASPTDRNSWGGGVDRTGEWIVERLHPELQVQDIYDHAHTYHLGVPPQVRLPVGMR